MGGDDNGGGWGVLAGSSIVIVQVLVLAPGLLPLLLLTAAFAVPLALPLIPLALLAGLFFGIRALGRVAVRLVRVARPRRPRLQA
jgi:hypothetical protein